MKTLALIFTSLLFWSGLACAFTQHSAVTVGTSVTKVLACGSAPHYLKIYASGGTAGTDSCRITIGPPPDSAGRCFAPTAPSTSTPFGDPVGTGPLATPLVYTSLRSVLQDNDAWMSGEIDAICTASGMSVAVDSAP